MIGADGSILQFDSTTLPPAERFDRYRDMYSNGVDVSCLGPDFAACVTAWSLDRVTIYERTVRDAGHVRGPDRAGVDGFDHIMLSLVVDGALNVDTGRGFVTAPAGCGIVLDISLPMSNRIDFVRYYNVRIARDDFLATIGPLRNLHGTVIPNDRAALLIGYVTLLTQTIDTLATAARRSAIDAMFLLITGALGGGIGGALSPASARDTERLSRIRALIDTHIANPDLSPDLIVQHAQLSRATLYRLFTPFGGFASHVQTRRLQLLLLALNDDTETRSFATIALDAGFRSEAHASRLFQSRYGLRPGQYRSERAARADAAVPIREMQFLDDAIRSTRPTIGP